MLITSLIALLSTGLLSGILLGNLMGPSSALPKIPDSSFVRFQQAVHVNYVRIMPILQIAAILSSVSWLFLLHNLAGVTGFVLLAAAAAGSVIVFAITLTVNVPVNKRLMTWNALNPPADVREVWRPWETGHAVRTILAVVVFLLEAVVMAMASRPSA